MTAEDLKLINLDIKSIVEQNLQAFLFCTEI